MIVTTRSPPIATTTTSTAAPSCIMEQLRGLGDHGVSATAEKLQNRSAAATTTSNNCNNCNQNEAVPSVTKASNQPNNNHSVGGQQPSVPPSSHYNGLSMGGPGGGSSGGNGSGPYPLAGAGFMMNAMRGAAVMLPPPPAGVTVSSAQAPHTTAQPPYSDGEATPAATASAADSTDNDTSAEDPLKLFVGQIPKHMSEEDIFPTFDAFGPLKDVAIIRDKHTGAHRGCAFVTYWSSADAQKAQQTLHDQFTFAGGKRPTQVKPAEPSVPENKLFIGMLSRTAGEEDVQQIFEPFGEIREIHMIRSADGTSRCAAFLRYVRRESALQAIENLNDHIVMEGAARPLIVKFADNKLQRQQRHVRNFRKQQERMAAAVAATMGSYPPQPVVYHQHVGTPSVTHMPLGTIMPPPSQYPHHLPPPYPVAAPLPHPYYYHHQQHPFMPYGPLPSHNEDNNKAAAENNNVRPREGPAGANIFVYHLPHDLTDADLATAFNSFGNVISAKVFVDKYTGESKGFGFVSYDSVMAAEAAIEQMNGFQIGSKRLKVQHKRVHHG